MIKMSGWLKTCFAGKTCKYPTLLYLALALLMAIMPDSVIAQGDLLIMPRRLIFENATRIQELTLANTGKDSAQYLISMVEIRMKEDGSFEQITRPDSGQQFAGRYLRVYPRKVYIAPGESQLVKVQLIRSEQLVPGEYRSHIYVRAVPMEKPLGEKEAARDSTGISIKLTPIFGISIPTIIRVGENDTKTRLADPSFIWTKDRAPKLEITLNRTGQMSSYGDITVDCIALDGTVTQVGLVKGIAVYTPNIKRRFTLALDNTQKVDYHACKLHITYKTPKEAKVQDAAETELAVP